MKSYQITVERTELIEFTVQAKDEESALLNFWYGDETASKTTSVSVVGVKEGRDA